MTLALLSTKYINQDHNQRIINFLVYAETIACYTCVLLTILPFDYDNPSNNPWSKQTQDVMKVVSAIFLSMNWYSIWRLSLHDRRVIMLKELEEISVDNTKAALSLQKSLLAKRVEEALVKKK